MTDATIDLDGVQIDVLTADGTVQRIFDALATGEGGWLITYNLDILRRRRTDPEFERRSRSATLRVADGMPLVWAARLQGTPLPERVAGSDLVYDIVAAAERDRRSVLLLGGTTQEVADGAANRMRERHPSLIVVGTASPPVGFLDDAAEVDALRRLLDDTTPDIVLIGLPPNLQAAVHATFSRPGEPTWWIGIGVTFSFVTGDVKRAPAWMQRSGLEWSYRLYQEPRRLGRRYLLEGPTYLVPMLARCVRRRWRNRLARRPVA